MLTNQTKTEVFAGFSSFLATCYIVVVNPAILSAAGMPFTAVITATILVTAFGSIMMGLYAKNPIVVAPGMGMNAFFTFTAVKQFGLSYATALGAVFWAGIVFLILSIVPIRQKIVEAIPASMRYAVSIGIGLFISLVGLQNAHIVVDNPATLISLAPFKKPETLTFFIGLILTIVLVLRKVPAALVIGIILTTILAYPIGRYWGNASAINFGTATLVNYNGFFAKPDFSLIGQLDWLGSLKWSVFPIIFVFIFTGMFDGLSTLVGLSEAAQLNDANGQPKNLKKSLIVDASTSILAGIVGSSPGTAYIESAVGISQGGRQGLTAVVAGLCFLPLLFFSPLLSMIPAIASSIALVLVGVYLMEPVKKINWNNLEEAFPAFLTVVLIPFSYSINHGILLGMLAYSLIKICLGKISEISFTLLIINILSIISFILL